MTVALRAPRSTDYDAIAAWIPDSESCRVWAGPRVPFPFSSVQLPRLLAIAGSVSYSLAEDAGAPLAFGQHWPHASGSIHLGRIIVAPAARGQGYGRELCRGLAARALSSGDAGVVTLFVYRSNIIALALYYSLGFAVSEPESTCDALFLRMTADTFRGAGY